MPELPEVETMRRGIAGIVGCRIGDVRRPRSRLRPIRIEPRLRSFRRRAVDRRIVSVGRIGKRVVIELDEGDRIVIEPRMTGRVVLSEPSDGQCVRVVFDLLDGRERRLLFVDRRGLGVVRLLSPEEFAVDLGPDRVGPDALEISPQELRTRLGASRRAIKVALLDQRAVAGIGNLYASEILHRARLHPAVPCRELRPVQWQRVHASMREVLEEAVRLRGSTLSDGTYRNARDEAGAYQACHRVYGRASERCLQCARGRIVRVVQAQRSTFYCPSCQRPRRGFPQ